MWTGWLGPRFTTPVDTLVDYKMTRFAEVNA